MNRILVVAPNWIGDMLMAQPLLSHLKVAQAPCSITVMAPEPMHDLLEAMPEVDHIIDTRFSHGRLHLQDRLRISRRLATEGFDAAYILPNSLKSALIPWKARVPRRIGYRGRLRRWMLTESRPTPTQAIPMVDWYLGIDGSDRRESIPAPHLVVSAQEIAAVHGRFSIAGGKPLFALCPGAEFGPAKRWPVAYFAELARRIAHEEQGATIIVVGGPADREAGEAIETQADAPVRNLCGQTRLGEAIALLAGADAVISNDSGLMHVAAALARPQVAVYGSSDPRHTPPLSPLAKPLWLHLSCSPCFKRTCPLGHTRCLTEIEPALVHGALREVRLRERTQ